VGGGIRPRRGVDDGEAKVGGAVKDGVGGGARGASIPSAQSALSPQLSPSPPSPPLSPLPLPPCLSSSPPAPEESHPCSSSFSSSHQSLCGAYSDWPSIREKISFDDEDNAEVDRPPARGREDDNDDDDEGSDPRLILRAALSTLSDNDFRHGNCDDDVDDDEDGDIGGGGGGGEGGEVATLLRRHYAKVFKTSAGEVMMGSEFLSLRITRSDNNNDVAGIIAATCAEPDEMDPLAMSSDSQW